MAEIYEWRGSGRLRKSQGGKLRFAQRTDPHDPENMILAALPEKEYSYLRQHLEFVPLKFGDVLWEPNDPVDFVYFPTSGMVSFIASMRNAAPAEVGVTGREGSLELHQYWVLAAPLFAPLFKAMGTVLGLSRTCCGRSCLKRRDLRKCSVATRMPKRCKRRNVPPAIACMKFLSASRAGSP